MEIYMELNQRFGRGFQLRVLHGPMDKVYDTEPWTMSEAGAHAGLLLEMINKELGTKYQPHQVLRVTNEAMEVNAKYGDFSSARMLQDIQSKKFELSTPFTQDFRKDVIDGEEQILLTGRGVVIFSCFTWKKENNQKAKEAMRRYCEYIAVHGFKGGAKKALAEVERLEDAAAVEWIRKTYARHVHDDKGLIQYVMERG